MTRAPASILLCCGLLQCTLLVNADEKSSSSPQLLFSDDFTQAVAENYEVEGPAEGFVIEGGALAVSRGAKVSRNIYAAQPVVIEFELRVPEEIPEEAILDFSIGFPVAEWNFRCSISHFPSSQSPGEYSANFELFTEGSSWAWSRPSTADLRELDGRWRLALADGRLRVEKDGQRLFQHFLSPSPLLGIDRIDVESRGVAVYIDSLSCRGHRLSADQRKRLGDYASRSRQIAAARSASADQRHAQAAPLWRECVDGWPIYDEQTAYLAFVQMEAGLAEITSGHVTDGLSRLERAWPSLVRAVDEDHPWRIAGESLLREACERLKGQVPDQASLAEWNESFSEMWNAWADVSWKGKRSLEHERRLVERGWNQIARLDKTDLAALEQILQQSSLAQSTFAQGDPELALRQVQTAVRQLKRMLDRGGYDVSFVHEELGDLLTLSARCQFLLADLDLKELDRTVRSAQRSWAQSLPEDHPKRLVAAHHVACVDYLNGDWIQAENSLRRVWRQASELLGEGAPQTLGSQADLGMLQLILGQVEESERLRVDTLWRYAELTAAGWLPVETPTLDVFSVRQELIEHPSLIMMFLAAVPGPGDFDPLSLHADSLALARLAARVDQIMIPFQSDTPWNEPSSRASSAIEKLAPANSPLRTMSLWLGTRQLFDEQFAALPEAHPWRVWLQRRDATVNAFTSPPAAPVRELDEFQESTFQRLQAALEDSITVFGEDHPESAWCHEALAVANYTLGRFDEAKRHAAKSTEVFARSLQPRQYRTLAIKNTLGVVEYYRRDLKRAFELLQGNVRDRREVLGSRHLETLRSLSDLSVVARSLGQYQVARMLIELAIKQWPESDAVGQSLREHRRSEYKRIVLVNRCVLQAESGDYASAEAGFQELLEGHDFKGRIDQRREILLSLSSLSIMKDDLRKAEGYLLQAQELLRQGQFAPEDPQLDHSLGVVYRELGELERSREHLMKALEQRRENRFGEPYELGDNLTSVGILEQKEGNLEKALQYFAQAAKEYQQQLGPIGLRQADAIRRIALVAWLLGNNELATKAGDQALKMKGQLSGALTQSLSEAETLLFAKTITELEPLLSVLSVDRQKNAAMALESVWRRKAIVARLLERRHVRLRSTVSAEVEEKAERLRVVRRELATLLGPQFVPHLLTGERLVGPGGNFFEGGRFQRIQQLVVEKEQLERDMAALAGNTEPNVDVTLEAVAEGLSPNTALVEFVKVNIWPRADQVPSKVDIEPEARYQVFVLYKDANNETQLTWNDLGPAAEVDKLVSDLRRFIPLEMRRSRGLEVLSEQEGLVQDGSIYERLGQRVAASWIDVAPDCRHIYIVPDGLLHGLPWAALPGDGAKHLIQETSISLLTRGPELIRRHSTEEDLGRFLLVGDVAYGKPPAGAAASPRWVSLQGTRNEVLSIGRLTRGRYPAIRLESTEATEAMTIEHLATSKIAHLATHGFFTPHDDAKSAIDTASWRDPMLASVAGRNPLSRCGVVLANANQLPQLDAEGIPYGNDGLLTGEELCDLDLRRLELVVLSACETSLGQIADNEGVFSLHRALSRAGARATIGSLWQVSDEATTQLMTEFYRNWLTQNVSVADGLRQAQLQLLNEKSREGATGFAAPYFWAAFVVSGDPDVTASDTQQAAN